MYFFPRLLSSLLIMWCTFSYGGELPLLKGNEGSYRAMGLGRHKGSDGQNITQYGEGMFSITGEWDYNTWWLKGKFVYDQKAQFNFVLRRDEVEKYFKNPIQEGENGSFIHGVCFQKDCDGNIHPFTETSHKFKSCYQFKFKNEKLIAFRIQYLDDEGVTQCWEISRLTTPGSDRNFDWDF